MSLFKKKPKEKEFPKEMEVLNYTPINYFYSAWYERFLDNAEEKFHKMIEKTNADDLCQDMLDSFIDANTDEMKVDANTQYTQHMHIINCHKGLLDGKIAKAEGYLENIRQDLASVDQEIALLKQKQREKGIY